MERIELIRCLNNKLLRKLNEWSLTSLKGLCFSYKQYSDFCCEAKRKTAKTNMTIEEMQQIYDFFKDRFFKHKIGLAITESEIYLGTAHLSTSELEALIQISNL